MLRKGRRYIILLMIMALLLSMLAGCKVTSDTSTSGSQISSNEEEGESVSQGLDKTSKSSEKSSRASSKTASVKKRTIQKGRAKGFVALSKEDKEYFGAIKKKTLFVPETHYSNQDKTVYIANVVQYGAVGDGATDDFDAFYNALRAASEEGGGTVFVPEGTYYISRSLVMPKDVCLRGEYDSPKTSGYGGGTNILTDVSTTGIYNTPFITLSNNSGVRNLAFYYLNQNFTNPVDLSPCIGMAEGSAVGYATVENIMVYNAAYPYYFGTGHGATEMNNLWATPLKIGMLSDNNGETTNFVNFYMDEQYYANCGFVGAPQNDSDRKKLSDTLQNAIAYVFERHDSPCVNSIYSHGIGTGLVVRESSHPRRTTWANSGGFGGGCSLYNFEFTDCHTGIRVENLLVSASFILGRIKVNDTVNSAGIRITYACETASNFNNITIEGTPSVAFFNGSNDGNFEVLYCTFTNWKENAVVSTGGHLHMTGCNFKKKGSEINADGSVALGLINCTFAGEPKISTAGIEKGNFYRSTKPIDKDKLAPPPTETYDFMTKKPSAAKFDIYNAADYGIDEFGEEDCTKAINKALSDAKAKGGGIVYVPAGVYRLDGTLYVPEGVELRGIYENAYNSNDATKNTVFYVYGGKGKTKGDGAIVLEKNAGVKGFSIYYPEQSTEGYKDGEEYTPYPYTITAKGPGCWVIFVTCVNSYYMVDFGSAKDCSNYVIYGLRGQPLKIGIFGGNNSGTGRVEHCNLSLGPWTYGGMPYRPYFGAGTYDAAGMQTNALWKAYVYDLLDNCDYMVFGYNKKLLLYGNLSYATRHAQRYISQNGKYTENAKVYFQCMDVTKLSVKIEKAGNLYFVYGLADCEMAPDCGTKAISYGNAMNTIFPNSLTVHGGTLNLCSANVWFMTFPVFLNVTGGNVNITAGLLRYTPEVLVKATGGKVNISGMVVRKRRGLLIDTDSFIIHKSGNAVVQLEGCMSTNKI